MKKLLIYLLCGYFGWLWFVKEPAVQPPVLTSPPTLADTAAESSAGEWDQTESFSTAEPEVFRCDGRQHCSQMRSKAEAVFFLHNCPDTKMDGDGDGDPCERQFN